MIPRVVRPRLRTRAQRRQQLRSAIVRVKPSRWCSGISGLQHRPYLLVSGLGQRRIARGLPACGPERGIGQWGWSCGHVIACSECGRRLQLFPTDACPDRPGAFLDMSLDLYRGSTPR